MLINDAILLANGSEIKALKVKDDTDAILGYVNQGVLELHKRFQLIQNTATITLVAGVTRYRLDGTDDNVAISTDDTDMLSIIGATDGKGCSLDISPTPSSRSISNPEYGVIDVPAEVADEILKVGPALSLAYRASPTFALDAGDVLRLPPQYLEPLLNYIGYRAHASIKGGIKDENNTHYLRFDKSCKDLNKQEQSVADSLSTDQRFYDRGFV